MPISTEIKDEEKGIGEKVEVVIKDAGETREELEQFVTLGSLMSNRFSTWSSERINTEERWLRNMRAYYRKHEAATLAKIKPNRSKAFLGLTKVKTKAGYARLLNAFFSGGEAKHWSISPTPVPETKDNLSTEDIDKRVKQIIDEIEMPEDVTEKAKVIMQVRTQIVNEIRDEEKRDAEAKAKEMARLIEDQLAEASYEMILRRALFQASMIGNGAIKAGTVQIKREIKFVKNGKGKTETVMEENVSPGIEFSSIFDLFPDPDAIDMECMTGIYERHILSRAQLKELKKFHDFRGNAIDELLERFPRGNYTPLSYESELENIGDQTSKIDSKNRFEVLEYWGDVEDFEILDALKPNGEKLSKEFNQINIWTVADVVIKVGYLKSFAGRLPYYIFPYDIVEEQFWGTGVPESMMNSQKDINTATRMMLDSAAFVHIPNLEVNVNMLQPGHAVVLSPGKIWYRTSGDPAFDAVRAIKFPSSIPELLNIISLFRSIIDEETNLPALITGQSAEGQASLSRTASGISMVLGTANVVGQSVVKNVDDFLVRPMIKGLYIFNMQWSSDETIKGDMKVLAKGTSNLQAREIELNQLVNFSNITNNETDIGLTHRDELLRAIAEKLNLDAGRFLKSAEEIQRLIDEERNDPEARQRIALELQKIQVDIEAAIAKAEKDRAAVVFDQEIVALKTKELQANIIGKAAEIESGKETKESDAATLERINRTDDIESNNQQ